MSPQTEPDAGRPRPKHEKTDRRGRRRAVIPILVPILLLLGSAALSLLASPTPVEAQDNNAQGAQLFNANCASCHQAGGIGIPGTFPPLAGNERAADPAYVADVIQNGLTGPLTVDGVDYDSAMPAIGALSGADLDAVVNYVVGIASVEQPSAPATPVDEPIVGDLARGRDLFRGSERLGNSGPACAACHTAGSVSNLGGSSLGPDLTNVLDTLGGEAGFIGWMANPPSPTMAPLFEDKPLSDQEIADLASYLNDTPNQDQPSGPDRLLLAALGGLVILIGGMAFFWRGMRQTYVELLRSKR